MVFMIAESKESYVFFMFLYQVLRFYNYFIYCNSNSFHALNIFFIYFLIRVLTISKWCGGITVPSHLNHYGLQQ